MVERREPVALTVFKEWTTCLFRLIPARFAISFALGCLFWAIAAPAGLALHLLGGVLALMVFLPLTLAGLRRRNRRRQQQAAEAATKPAVEPRVEPAVKLGSETYEKVLKARFGNPGVPVVFQSGNFRSVPAHGCKRSEATRRSRRSPRSRIR